MKHVDDKPSLESYTAIILDFDGVIADSESAQISAWKWALSKFEIEIDMNKLMETVGMKDERIVEYLLDDESSRGARQKVLEAKIWKTSEMYREGGIQPVPGVIDFIKAKCKSHILAIATNSRSNRAEKYCRSLRIDQYFRSIVTGGEALPPKPHPDIYLKTLEKLSLTAEKCIVIEDSLIGVQSAKNANLCCIGLANTLSKDALEGFADWVIESFAELD